MKEYIEMWKRGLQFEGTSTRKDFWMALLIDFVLMLALGLVIKGTFTTLIAIVTIVPSLALSVRRLHDIGKSGLLLLLAFIPIIGLIILIVYFCTATKTGENQYNVVKKV